MHGFSQSLPQAHDEVANLIGTEDVAGLPVFDGHGRRLGWIEQVMFDKFTGRATYAVVAARVTGQQHPVPWSYMRYAGERSGYEIEIDAEAFARAPSLADEGTDWSDPEMRRKILDFYKRPVTV